MAFNFELPTTSTLAFSTFLRCDSHPSLLLTATAQRTLLRNTLKTHKRLPANARATNQSTVLSAINAYLPYLLVLEQGLAGHLVGLETVFVALTSEPETSWRSSILSPLPGRQVPRISGKGLDYEILFVLATAAYTHCLESRRHLAPFVSQNSSSRYTTEQRKTGINAAVNSLLTAHSLFVHAGNVAETVPAGSLPPSAIDIQTSTLIALAEIAWASATLLAVVKDDDFLVLAAQARDSDDKEWMYKPPNIPKVRAHLFARLCLAAAEHASKAVALLSGVPNVREDLVKYAKDLAATARARSCRFFGVDAEIEGKLGNALGWINAARRILGLPVNTAALSSAQADGKSKFKPSLTAMKTSWNERKERKGLESSKPPSLDDPGRVEEGRVLEILEKNWSKTNDLIGHHLIADENVLLQEMPSGREIHNSRTWSVPTLDSAELEKLRAPADRDELGVLGDSDASDDDEGTGMPGAWESAQRSASGPGPGRNSTAVDDGYF